MLTQLGIIKKGDSYLRKLLVGSAQYTSAGSHPILTYDAGGWNWPDAAALMPRNGQLLRSLVNWLFCFIDSGLTKATTNHFER